MVGSQSLLMSRPPMATLIRCPMEDTTDGIISDGYRWSITKFVKCSAVRPDRILQSNSSSTNSRQDKFCATRHRPSIIVPHNLANQHAGIPCPCMLPRRTSIDVEGECLK